MDADQALKVFIEFGVLNQDQAEAASAALGRVKASAESLTTHLPEGAAAYQKYKGVLEEATAAGEKENISMRERRESIRALTVAFPGLAEAAMFALNPITLAAFAIGGAFEIFKKRVEEATNALSAVEMPDLTSGIDQANSLAEAWNGISTAIDDVMRKYNSAESVFTRDKQNISLDAEIKKKLGLGGQTPGEIDAEAQQQELAAKERELANAQIAAQNEAQAAAAIKLPGSDDAVKAQLDELKKRAATQLKIADDASKEKAFISQLGSNGLIGNQEDYYQFYEKYGRGQTVQGAMQIQQKIESDARADAAAVNREIVRRSQEEKQRDQLRTDAARDAGVATSLGLELPGDRATAAEKSAMDLLQPGKSGTGTETVTQLRAHIAENQRVQRELQQAAAELIQSHSGSSQTMLDVLKQLRDDLAQTRSQLHFLQLHQGI